MNEAERLEMEEESRKYAEINEAGEGAELKITHEDIEKDMAYITSEKDWDALELPKELKENLLVKNYKKPSKIQSSVIGFFQKKIPRDLIAQAQNGSGKTLAFVVPSILIASNEKSNPITDSSVILNPSVVILGDTKELCYQTLKVFTSISFEGVRAGVCLKELTEMDVKVDVMLTTVGSLVHFSQTKKINIKRIRLLVLDECDRLFSQDFARSKLPLLVKKIAEANAQLQVCYISATLTPDCVAVINSLNRKTTTIAIENKQELSLKNLTHFYIRCDRRDKFNFVNDFFKKFSVHYFDGSVIMFVNNKQFAERLAKNLFQEGHRCEILTSDMSHEDRIQIMAEFKAGKIKILISTNLLARGIDNRKINLVINYDLPFIQNFSNPPQVPPQGPRKPRPPQSIDGETYLHRVGRTARFGDQGIALNIIERDEELADLKRVTGEFGINLIEITMENFMDVIEKNKSVSQYNAKKREILEENI